MFTVKANGNNPLGGYGIGEIIENGFESREDATDYVLEGWGETALQQVLIDDDDAESCDCGAKIDEFSREDHRCRWCGRKV